jgi:hypothetical protein
MTQQSVCRHVAHDRTHYPVSEATSFGLTAKSCVLSGESGNTIFIVFGLTQPMLESIIFEMLLVLATAYLNFFSLGVKHIDCMYRFVLYHYRSIALNKTHSIRPILTHVLIFKVNWTYSTLIL